MSEQKPGLFVIWIFFWVAVRLLLPAPVAAYLLALVLQALGLLQLSPFWWVASFPLIYAAWLLIFLLVCAVETSLLHLFLRRSESATRLGSNTSALTLIVVTQYGRSYLFGTLPLLRIMVGMVGFRQLVFRAYAPSTHLAPTCSLSTLISDPDNTFIGDGSVIGGGVELVAHSHVRLQNGDTIFKAAPIRIGRNVTIGGNARLELGVTVGDGAIIEPFSHVVAYTRVGPGEVWSGNPATLNRGRGMSSESKPAVAVPVAQTGTPTAFEKVQPAIAQALNLPLEKITPESRMEDLVEWDSLGKIAIAAALHDRFGLELAPEQIFQLNSVADVSGAVEKAERAASSVASNGTEFALPRRADLLPLGDPALTTAALAAGLSPITTATLRICIAATTVAEPLAPTLQVWCRAFGVEPDISFAGFNQVQTCLLQSDSIFHQNRAGLNVAIVCAEDLTGSSAGDLTLRATQLLDAIDAFTKASLQPIWVTDLAPMLAPDPMTTTRELDAARALWSERLSANSRVRILPLAQVISELGLTAATNPDPAMTLSTRFSAQAYQRLGIEISRAARPFHVPPRKVLALDADDTLWLGLVGEDGPERIEIGPLQRQLQRRAKVFKEKGGLLALVSRNEAEDVWAAWRQNKEMVLRPEDFAAVRINWKPKSENLREIAGELNLGLDSFVFVDDSRAERVEVEARCPEVLVIPSPTPGAQADLLGRLWCFDALAITQEDHARSALMGQERERTAAKDGEANLEKYLLSLDLQVTIRRATTADLARVAQLTQKTNQFNLSLRRRTVGELEQLLPDHEIWTISARDRFGDYGMIGVGILSAKDDFGSITLDSFLLSCRALNRGIEQASLCFLGETASASGAGALNIPFVVGPRNAPVRDFFDQKGWKVVGPEMGQMSLPLRLSFPAHLRIMT